MKLKREEGEQSGGGGGERDEGWGAGTRMGSGFTSGRGPRYGEGSGAVGQEGRGVHKSMGCLCSIDQVYIRTDVLRLRGNMDSGRGRAMRLSWPTDRTTRISRSV